ncbi:MAG: GAF domain-containing protein, partial [Chloroflexi bacterium]|nr:GAF domain-containing protein [Chloroflexota bacterium]
MSEKALYLLLVDDEASMRDPLTDHLRRKFEYEVISAATYVEAFEAVRDAARPIDVALIDDMIEYAPGDSPRRLGIKLMEAIRELSPDTEFILFTGWGFEEGLEAMRAGAYRYIRKPFDLDELGILIQHAAEYRQIKQEKQWLQTFLEIGKATTSQLEFKQVLEEVHRQIARVLDASNMDIILFEEAKNVLRFELGFTQGRREEPWDRLFTPGKGLTDWIINHRKPLLIKDFQKEKPPVEPYQKGWEARSWLGVPLIVRDKIIGAITVQSQEPNQFNETDRDILAAVASQVAIAIANARLFFEKEAYAKELEKVRKAALDLGAVTEEAPLLNEIVAKAVDLLRARSGGIYAYNELTGELKVVADYSQNDSILGQVLRVGEGMAGRLVASGEPYMVVEDYALWP